MKPLRIAIADDDGVTLMVLRKVLTEMGHQVVAEAADGQQAVALIKQHNPDLAILDIRMPNMDGLGASRAIQEACATAVIVLSAYTEEGLGQEAANSGADAYLVKPFNAQQLAPAIELALANKKKFRQINEQLETRKLVERAKGILMRQTGMDEEGSYLTLQKAARNENKKMADVARAVILADQLRQSNASPSSTRTRN
ncbi:MAG: response regulator [Verrucomicrobia bacterium]|nr:response regulator [Verrucomicrobiota bacterium]